MSEICILFLKCTVYSVYVSKCVCEKERERVRERETDGKLALEHGLL